MDRRLAINDILLDAFEVSGIDDTPMNRALGKKWAENALILIGVMPEEYEHKAAEVESDFGKFKKPAGMLVPLQVFLCIGGQLIEATYAGKNPSSLWRDADCCTFYKGYHGSYGVKDDGDYFFLTDQTIASTVQKMIIVYLSLFYDDNGDVLTPYEAREAVVSYLHYYFTKRERSRDRSKVPMEEVASAQRDYQQQIGYARSVMKMPTKLEMERLTKESWARVNAIRQPKPYYS